MALPSHIKDAGDAGSVTDGMFFFLDRACPHSHQNE
jgi:hypothetical protein